MVQKIHEEGLKMELSDGVVPGIGEVLDLSHRSTQTRKSEHWYEKNKRLITVMLRCFGWRQVIWKDHFHMENVLFLVNFYFIFMLCVRFFCMYVCASLSWHIHGGQKEGIRYPRTGVIVLWDAMWLLGFKPRASAKSPSVLSCWTISPAPFFVTS